MGAQGATAFKSVKQHVDFKDWGSIKHKLNGFENDHHGKHYKPNDVDHKSYNGEIKTQILADIVAPDFDKIYSSASEAYKGSTKIGHALSKHSGRHPEIWGNIKGAQGTWHSQANEHLQDIIKAPGHFQKVTNSRGISWVEKRLPDGRGVRLNLDNTFKGFIDQNE